MATNINRDQLAKALGGDPRLIRQIELLAAQSTSTPTQLQDIALASEAANAKAGAALGAVQRLAEEVAQAASDAVAASARAVAAMASIQRIADDVAMAATGPGAKPVPGLSQLRDVVAHTPVNGELLQYNAVQQRWENVTDLALRGQLTIPKTSGYGIRVDPDAPTFGWRDLTSDIQVGGAGGNDPTFAVYTGTALRAYQFSATVLNEVFMVFHVPHDWVPGSAIYFHTHWSNAATVPNTGNVKWNFDYSFAKGFGQEAFPVVQTATVTAASPATRYTHNVSETTSVTIPTMEVDGLILVRAYRDAANAADTCTDAVFLHTVDIHYQSSNMATKNKSPNFYA